SRCFPSSRCSCGSRIAGISLRNSPSWPLVVTLKRKSIDLHYELKATARVQDRRRRSRIRADPPAELQNLCRRNPAAQSFGGSPARGQISRREHLPDLPRRKETRRHARGARQSSVLARSKAGTGRFLSAARPEDLRNPVAGRGEKIPRRAGVAGNSRAAL